MRRREANDPGDRGLRRFLHLTAATTGAVILVVEILGAKMLSPWFGTSHFVWTAQIAVTLISLALGYWLGGTLADRGPGLSRLYLCLLAAGAWLCLATVLLRPVSRLCLHLSLAAGSVTASLFLFLVPLTLMAVTGPFVIRALTRSASDSGRQSGRLFAISTLGSVLGVVLVGYVLIPRFPNSVTMFGAAATLFLLVAAYFLVRDRRHLTRTVLVALAALPLGYLGIRQEARGGTGDRVELHRRNSPYGLLQVLDAREGDARYFLNDWLTQNIYHPPSGRSLALFTYMLHDLAVAYRHPPERVLVIGLGIGIVPRQFAAEGVRVDVVEINPEVEAIAREFFDFDPAGVDIHPGDGRRFLLTSKETYDAVILDAFVGDSVPVHLMTRECFRSVRERLAPDGLLVINCFGYFQPRSRDFLPQSLARTLRSVFPSLRIHDSGRGNLFFVASPKEDLEVPRFESFDHVHPRVRDPVVHAFRNRVEPDPGRGMVLRDDHNPVEFHDAAVREQLRRGMVHSMK